MSSNLTGPCHFLACPILRIEEDDVMSFSALSSEAVLAPGMSGLVPENAVKQVSNGKAHATNELTHVFKAHGALLLHGSPGLSWRRYWSEF